MQQYVRPLRDMEPTDALREQRLKLQLASWDSYSSDICQRGAMRMGMLSLWRVSAQCADTLFASINRAVGR